MPRAAAHGASTFGFLIVLQALAYVSASVFVSLALLTAQAQARAQKAEVLGLLVFQKTLASAAAQTARGLARVAALVEALVELTHAAAQWAHALLLLAAQGVQPQAAAHCALSFQFSALVKEMAHAAASVFVSLAAPTAHAQARAQK